MDDNFAYFAISVEEKRDCSVYKRCEIVNPPFTDGKYSGGTGWLFPKRSPFLPIINKFFRQINEAGLMYRIYRQPEFHPTNMLLPNQVCETLDGDPISMHKVVSLFVLFAVAFSFTLVIFWYVKEFSLYTISFRSHSIVTI